MSSYTTYDFAESMKGEGVEYADIAKVHAAWGNVNSEGACCEECGGEWSGGFLVELKRGSFAYVTGWCDYTGWGCQDGTSKTEFAALPDLASLEQFPVEGWDKDPADLNLAITKPNEAIY